MKIYLQTSKALMSGERIFEKDQTPLISYTLLGMENLRKLVINRMHVPDESFDKLPAVDYKTSDRSSE